MGGGGEREFRANRVGGAFCVLARLVRLSQEKMLEGSWVVSSKVVRALAQVMSLATSLRALLRTTHEPSSAAIFLGLGNLQG